MATIARAAGNKLWWKGNDDLEGRRMATIPHVPGNDLCWKGNDDLEG